MRKNQVFWGSLFLLTVGLNLAARLVPGFAEWYAGHIYPLIVGSFARFCSLVPFSVAEILLYALLLSFLAGLLLILVRRLSVRRAVPVLAKTVIALCLMFTLNCGINYHRQTFSERAGFELQESSVEELRALCEKLAEELNEAAGAIHVDAEGHMMLEENVEAEAAEAMQAAAEEYPELAGYYPKAKKVLGSWLLSYQQLQPFYFGGQL